MQRSTWLTLALAGLGAAGWLAFGSGPSDVPFDDRPIENAAADDDSAPADVRVAARSGAPDDAPDDVDRRELELVQELAGIDARDFEARVSVAVSGRVVDAGGAPIAAAVVVPTVRRDPRAIFAAGREGLPEGVDWRGLMRHQPLAKATRTDSDGRFRIDGSVFRLGSTVRLAIEHERFAPALVQRDWTPDDGAIELPDVVLGAGATVTGVVVGPGGAPVPSAAVVLGELTTAAAPRERGGRGGRGRGPGRDEVAEALAELVGDATTDAAGRFTIDRVPAGMFQLHASASRHVDGRSDAAEAVDGQTIDVGALRLGPGALLSGVVTDAAGRPIAGAEVEATASRAAAPPGGPRLPSSGGPRTPRGGPMQQFGARQVAMTGDDGRFVLDRIPPIPLRIAVRHPRFVDADVEPIDPTLQAEMRVRMQGSPSASGTVLDARTGEPIERFGIRARPMPPGMASRAGRMGQLADAAPEIAERIAEMQARFAREESWRRQQLGGAGLVPGRTPEPEQHPDGRFVLHDLQPGEYVFDVDAPGYVRVAAGPFTVAAGAANDGATIRLERGFTLAGRVVDGKTREPVAGARIALAIQPLDGDDAAGPVAFSRFGGRGGRGPIGMRDQLDSTRSAADGSFELRMMRAGTYVLTVDAEGFPGLRDPAYTLGPGSADVVLSLDPGGRVHGTVHGAAKGERLRLEFTHAESGETRRTETSPEDGSYSLDGLVAGGWFVRQVDDDARGGRRGGGFVERIGTAVAARAGSPPDLHVPAGGSVRYDFAVEQLQLATVHGQLLRNGVPAGGYELRLTIVGLDTQGDPGAERFARGAMGRLWSDRASAEDGTFRIESVPPGEYQLEVHPSGGRAGGRRGGNGPLLNLAGAALHSERIAVRKGESIERRIALSLGAARLTLTGPDGQPVPRARVSIVREAEAAGLEPADWRTLPSFARLGVEAGVATSDALQPGAYRFQVEARGFLPQSGPLVVAAGDQPTELAVRLETDPNASPTERPAEPRDRGDGAPNAGNRRRG